MQSFQGVKIYSTFLEVLDLMENQLQIQFLHKPQAYFNLCSAAIKPNGGRGT